MQCSGLLANAKRFHLKSVKNTFFTAKIVLAQISQLFFVLQCL